MQLITQRRYFIWEFDVKRSSENATCLWTAALSLTKCNKININHFRKLPTVLSVYIVNCCDTWYWFSNLIFSEILLHAILSVSVERKNKIKNLNFYFVFLWENVLFAKCILFLISYYINMWMGNWKICEVYIVRVTKIKCFSNMSNIGFMGQFNFVRPCCFFFCLICIFRDYWFEFFSYICWKR